MNLGGLGGQAESSLRVWGLTPRVSNGGRCQNLCCTSPLPPKSGQNLQCSAPAVLASAQSAIVESWGDLLDRHSWSLTPLLLPNLWSFQWSWWSPILVMMLYDAFIVLMLTVMMMMMEMLLWWNSCPLTPLVLPQPIPDHWNGWGWIMRMAANLNDFDENYVNGDFFSCWRCKSRDADADDNLKQCIAMVMVWK